jgi:hypothetical protein
MLAASSVLVAASCSAEPPADPGAVYLTPTEHLLRASMTLRGIRPSLAELRAVDADPDALPELVDGYLASPDFGATIRDLHNEALLLRIQQPNYTAPGYPPLGDRTYTELAASVFDEPLRLIEDVVMTGQPYTRIVTADYTMADDAVAAVWGIPHPGGRDWVRTYYPDDRGAAGILATSALYLRHRSTGFNHNRSRAAVLARALLCHDFASAGIELDTRVDLSDQQAVGEAVRSNPSCVGCHQTLDPLGSYFAGFYQGVLALGAVGYPLNLYRKEAEGDWAATTGRPPSYFGAAADGLAGLGAAIAADPRFARCAAERFASYLGEQPAARLDRAWISELQERFAAGGFDARRLARDIVLSDAFRTASHGDPMRAESVVGYQKVRPQQYARTLEDLTGYRWAYDSAAAPPRALWPRVGPIDALDDDVAGFRVLLGGIDSFYVTAPVHTMTATAALAVREAALRAAAAVVAHDAAAPAGERRLLAAAEPADIGEASLRAQLAHLHARIFGVLRGADVEPELELFRESLGESGDPLRAWTIVLGAMLSDLRTVYY